MIYSDIEINWNKMEEFVRLLLPENYKILSESSDKDIVIKVKEENNKINVETKLLKKSGNENIASVEKKIQTTYEKISSAYVDQSEVMAKTSLLRLFNKENYYKWGALVGVRPTKIVRRFLNMGLSYNKIKEVLKNIYFVDENKINLLVNIVKLEEKLIENDTVSIYIGIAFCPTKCTYCSFPAYILKGKYMEKYGSYIENLYRETAETGKLTKELKLKINTIYIGGGTPSILSEKEIENLLLTVKENYNLKYLKEFTFEAGRIDTLNKRKLEILKYYGVDRISINPQSFNEKTLKKVNRYHSKKEFDNIYNIARNLGLIVNMDLIIGLPGETTEDILNSLKEVSKYNIENLTIHNLAIKNASKLNKENYRHNDNLDYEKIYLELEKLTSSKKFYPYYMYRQKNSFEWGENTGYSLEGYESLYNMEMIGENKTVLGIGAGAVTKFIKKAENGKGEIERIVNPKDPLVWIDEFKKRLEEKKYRIYNFFK